jgi:toxin YoeB
MNTITFTKEALLHLNEWKTADPRILSKIVALVTDIAANPFTGIGKPEPLKHNLKGRWSRRINDEHRIVYEVKESTILILSCRFHY